MILPHTFHEEAHLYQTPGRYVLSTSDVIDLCGLSDMSQIPIDVLRHACYRGKCLHKAIERYEQGQEWQDDFPAEFMPYLDGWFAFRDAFSVCIVGPHEKPYVYLHDGTDQAIGATIDLRFIYQDYLWAVDVKSIHPVSGKALKQKQLAWRMQTQSYAEVTAMDEAFLTALDCYPYLHGIRRAIVHIHPKLKGGYAFHEFHMDDGMLWDGAVRIAQAKVAAGILPSRRDVTSDLRDSLEVMA
jgi:hypothetical protein